METRSLSGFMKEYFELLWINLSTQKTNFVEFLKVARKYYGNPAFRKIDLSLLLAYVLSSPFKISKEFLKHRGEENVYAYGETPLTTLEQIAAKCNITSEDIVYELGCGRGRSCFWLNTFIGCKVIGIDFIPDFIEIANEIKNKYQVQGVEFRKQDIVEAEYADATVIYLYGTSLADESIEALIEKFKSLPAGTKIITVSYSLADYTHEPLFEVMRRFPARFTWGTADVYLQIKK